MFSIGDKVKVKFTAWDHDLYAGEVGTIVDIFPDEIFSIHVDFGKQLFLEEDIDLGKYVFSENEIEHIEYISPLNPMIRSYGGQVWGFWDELQITFYDGYTTEVDAAQAMGVYALSL